MKEQKFANILLAGPCNLSCPSCIGQKLHDPGDHCNTLNKFPLPGLTRFTDKLSAERITQISLTGTDTEPMLYRHQEQLLRHLRTKISGAQISLHTNGTLILRHINLFNSYDRATISVPSLDPDTCLAMTGSRRVLDLKAILSASRIPIKISTLLHRQNISEIPSLVERFCQLGIRRIVLRKLYGGASPAPPTYLWEPAGEYAGNPVFKAGEMEITVWDFEHTTLPCINLFPDGRIADNYLLQPANRRPVELAQSPPALDKSRSIGVFLGSFDPPHRGHVWIVQEMLEHFDKVLLLIPRVHFHKTIRPGANASLDERLELLEDVRAIAPSRIGTGFANENLFLRLDTSLQALFPEAVIHFAMGNETYERLQNSEAYYQKKGLLWTAEERAHLAALNDRLLLFERTGQAPLGREVPNATRGISSTRVRAAVAALGSAGLDLDAWAQTMDPLVPPLIADKIRDRGLYRLR